MPAEAMDPVSQLGVLKSDLVAQGDRVLRMIEDAVDAVFRKDESLARKVVALDDDVDRADVAIERRAVDLLACITRGCEMSQHDLRLILTIVKVNNEYERIADLAAYIAERTDSFVSMAAPPPGKFRLLANSVIGIMAATNSAFADLDTNAATVVLSSDDTTEAFKTALMRDTEEALARGSHTVDFAFALNRMAASLGRIADHCTNVCEQVIYVETNKIVRHFADKWSVPTELEE